MSVPPIFDESSCLYLLISRHFVSPKCIFYFNVDKKASASACSSPDSLRRLCRWIPLGDFRPLDRLLCPPHHGDRSMPLLSSVADGKKCIWIKEKMLEFSSTVLSAPSLYHHTDYLLINPLIPSDSISM